MYSTVFLGAGKRVGASNRLIGERTHRQQPVSLLKRNTVLQTTTDVAGSVCKFVEYNTIQHNYIF